MFIPAACPLWWGWQDQTWVVVWFCAKDHNARSEWAQIPRTSTIARWMWGRLALQPSLHRGLSFRFCLEPQKSVALLLTAITGNCINDKAFKFVSVWSNPSPEEPQFMYSNKSQKPNSSLGYTAATSLDFQQQLIWSQTEWHLGGLFFYCHLVQFVRLLSFWSCKKKNFF